MCTGLELLAIAGTAVSTVSTISQGRQQQKHANAQAAATQRQADQQAELNRRNAERQAQQIEQSNAQAAEASRFQIEQARADAAAERGAAEVAAARTRKAAGKNRSEAAAALAAGGVEVGAGTPIKIDQAIVRSVEEDALQQMLYGERSAARIDQSADIAGLEQSFASDSAKQQAQFVREGANEQAEFLRQSAAEQSALYRQAGANARSASLLSAGGTALSGWANVAKGRRSVPAQQPPAPVYDRTPGGPIVINR